MESVIDKILLGLEFLFVTVSLGDFLTWIIARLFSPKTFNVLPLIIKSLYLELAFVYSVRQ